MYPAAIVVLITALLLRPDFLPAFVGSLVLFAGQLVRFALSGRRTSVLLNIVLGASLGMVLYSAVACPPNLRPYVYPFIISVIVSFEYLKGRRMLSRCKDCPERNSYPRCARGPMNIDDSK